MSRRAVAESMDWAYFPLAMQAVYMVSALPLLVRLWRAKRSDQHATVNHWLVLAADTAMTAWAVAYAKQAGLVIAFVLSFATTAFVLGTILRYQRFPGGKPRATRVRSHPFAASARESAWGSFSPRAVVV